ncbi:uncharacterized protein LOC143893746 isoform X2 [Temnothorax americanus]|uniref:uncharacterized protein LOC143893746 isoform X2 n=1 Tax=Temnothorax americanus TaxID=1964332 RepID=UPI0040694C9C
MINVIFARMETQAEEEIVRLDGEHQQEGSVIANGETEAKRKSVWRTVVRRTTVTRQPLRMTTW